jgi:hypothetical protein
MRKVRENIITAYGNQSVFPPDLDVYNSPNKYGRGQTINVLPGQLVVYDPMTLKSLGPGITADTNERIVWAVGIPGKDKSTSVSLRKVYGDTLFGCNINAASSESGKCGIPAIQDVLFKCTYRDAAYSIEVQIADEQTDNEYPFNTYATYVYTVKTEPEDCADCGSDHNCQELACKFVDAINGIQERKSRKTSFFTPPAEEDPKFFATRLYENSYDFCLTNESTACEDCLNYTGIGDVVIDGVTTTFTNTLNPSDLTLTLKGQVASIIDQINIALDGNGWAIEVKPVGVCCDTRIQINTCKVITFLGGVAPCDTNTPLDPITVNATCTNCDAVATTEQYCGIRLIQNLPQPECGSYPDLPGIRWFGGDLNVYARDGFSSGGFTTRKMQESCPPENMGYVWQQREWTQDVGGSGRNLEPYNDRYGTLGLPLASERIGNVTAKCDASYCSYSLEHSIPNTGNGVSSPRRDARGRSVFLIESTHSITIASFEAIMNPYLLSQGCPAKAAITCTQTYDTGLVDGLGVAIFTADQDQLESTAPGGEYPNANGRIY